MHGGARGEQRRGGGETTAGARARSARTPGPYRRRRSAAEVVAVERVEYRKSVHEWFVLTVEDFGNWKFGKESVWTVPAVA